MYEWEQVHNDQWECPDAFAVVGLDDGQYWWNVTVIEPFVSGPYPGSPDTHEYLLGEGNADSLNDAKWKAIRCWERALVAEDTRDWEEQLMYEQWVEDEYDS